jgi:hypothetical protein
MQNPLLITFHDLPHNADIETLITEKFEKIQSENPRVIKCHVRLEKHSKHHKKGNMASVQLDLKISTFDDIVITENCGEDASALKSAVIVVFKQGIDLARDHKKHRIQTKRIAVELPAAEVAAETQEE